MPAPSIKDERGGQEQAPLFFASSRNPARETPGSSGRMKNMDSTTRKPIFLFLFLGLFLLR
jgi:hypothetical protein